jgi:hypothetical protein
MRTKARIGRATRLALAHNLGAEDLLDRLGQAGVGGSLRKEPLVDQTSRAPALRARPGRVVQERLAVGAVVIDAIHAHDRSLFLQPVRETEAEREQRQTRPDCRDGAHVLDLLPKLCEPLADTLEAGILSQDALEVLAGHALLPLGEVVAGALGEGEVADLRVPGT